VLILEKANFNRKEVSIYQGTKHIKIDYDLIKIRGIEKSTECKKAVAKNFAMIVRLKKPDIGE
jgi:hypothetical protein